jgi:hypothetical protein
MGRKYQNSVEPPHGLGRDRKVALGRNDGSKASDDLLKQRDERIAADDRSDIEKFLGVPVPARSALGRRTE